MAVKIIRYKDGKEQMVVRRVKIFFVSGNVMVGDINIKSGIIEEDDDEQIHIRTSDFIKHCKIAGEPITVFNATYKGTANKTFFVILDNVESICEED